MNINEAIRELKTLANAARDIELVEIHERLQRAVLLLEIQINELPNSESANDKQQNDRKASDA